MNEVPKSTTPAPASSRVTTTSSSNSSLSRQNGTTSANSSNGTLSSLRSSDYDDDDTEEDDFLFLDLAAYADHSRSSSAGAVERDDVDDNEGPFLALPSFSEQITLERQRLPPDPREQSPTDGEVAADDSHPDRSTHSQTDEENPALESPGRTRHPNQENNTNNTNAENCSSSTPVVSSLPKRKSALKASSSYGNNMNEASGHHHHHHHHTKGDRNNNGTKHKSTWKKLPVPKLLRKGFGSSPSLLQSTTTPDSNKPTDTTAANNSHVENGNADTFNTPNSHLTHKNRTVSFSQIHVRDYEITVGDNPGGMQGTPVSLGWSYEEHAAIGVEQYEQHRPRRRSRQEMYLPSGQRQDMLLRNNTDLSRSEVVAAEHAADKIRKQRARTRAWIPLQKLEDLVESATRKAKRMGMVVAHPTATIIGHNNNSGSSSSSSSGGGVNADQHSNSKYWSQAPKNPSLPYSRSTGCLKSNHHGGLYANS